MKRQKAIFFLLSLACSITGALYWLARTHSPWSFIILCVVMVIAVMTTTAAWYAADDQQPIEPAKTTAAADSPRKNPPG
jgi:hypothetical protein